MHLEYTERARHEALPARVRVIIELIDEPGLALRVVAFDGGQVRPNTTQPAV
jgi:hypothetical protein